MGGQIIEKDQYEGRTNGFLMRPERLFLVGVDIPDGRTTPHGPTEHAGWDDRIHLPIDQQLGLSLLQEGNLQPVQVRKNGSLLEIVYGRQRTRAARWANEQIAAHWQEVDGEAPAGTCELPPHLRGELTRDTRVVLKVEIVRGDDKRMIAATAAENVHRRAESLVSLARKLNTYLERGHTWAEAKVTFGLRSDSDVANLRKLVDLAHEVQERITSGAISQQAALLLVHLSREEQVSVVKGLEAAGKRLTPGNLRAVLGMTEGKAKKASTAATKTAQPPVLPCDLQALLKVLEAAIEVDEPPFEVTAEEVLFLKWVCGGATTGEVAKYLPWLTPALQALPPVEPQVQPIEPQANEPGEPDETDEPDEPDETTEA